MAKKKNSRKESSSFFKISVLAILTLGLIVTTYAIQYRTNARSDASGLAGLACNNPPTIELIDTEDEPNYVVYKLKLYNNDYASKGCLVSRDFSLTKDIPRGWSAEFININDNPVNRLVNIGPRDAKRFEFWVAPRPGADPGPYSLSIKAKEELPPYSSDTIYLKYIKD